MSDSKRFWGFLAFLFWPWIVLIAPIAMIVVVLLSVSGRLTSGGPWYVAASKCVGLIAAAPLLLIHVAWRTHQRRLAIALLLLLPVMVACLGSLVTAEPSWQPEQGVTAAQAPSFRHPFGT
ncbi:MAG: hypothetical protein GY906_16670, partial [bacterium]|nr:hypothetical protein [bacterium]